MKKILYFLVATFILVATGCDYNFDPQITGVLSPVNFPQTDEEYELYALDCYRPFGSKWGYPGVEYQMMFFTPEYGHLAENDLPGDQFITFTKWGGLWEGFSKADFTFMRTQGRGSHYDKVRFVTELTKILYDLEVAETIREDTRTKLSAEVRMARGWAMFFLLNMYGPVPVILDPDKIGTDAEADQTRPSEEFFVAAITEDLQYAADNLPVYPSEYGRFNKGLALGILMRHYLQQKDWQDAIDAGNILLTLGYDLVDDYASLFKTATEVNNETIWAVTCDANATGDDYLGNFNAWSYYCYPNNMPGIATTTGWGPGIGVFAVNWDYYDTYDSMDVRRDIIVTSYKTAFGRVYDRSNLPGAVLVKYPDLDGAQYQGNDVVILRYADVLLMMAEAINNQNNGPTAQAIEYVNLVRRRAGIDDLQSSETSSRDAFNEAILRERGWELLFEGTRRLDLVRFGKWPQAVIDAGKIPGPSYLFPVPQYAIDVSDGKLVQTEGYE